MKAKIQMTNEQKAITPKRYELDTSADELLVELKRYKYCSDAESFCTKFAGRTVDEMVTKTPNQSWAAWYLRIFGENSEISLRKKMIAQIKDSMMAFSLYCKLSWLTEEEDKLLEDKFKGRLPTAEAELAQGIVARNKV